MAFFATAGAKVYIGDAMSMPSADLSSSDFSSVTWTEIKEVETIGSFGDTSSPVEHTSVGNPRTRTLKGARTAGAMELAMAIDYADAGQLALIAAEKTDGNYAFKVEFNDAPSGGTPSERLFVGVVLSAVEALNEVNNAMMLNGSIAINSNIVRVAAAEGS